MVASPSRTAERVESLDVFRGMAVAAMVLVSTPGTWSAVYPPLDHATWHGWTPTDLVFPFLLFAMGAAVPFALARRRGGGRAIWRDVARRTLLLFAFGLALNAIETTSPLSLASFRIPGVLQRVAIVYAATALIAARLSRRGQVLCAVVALGGYWVAMTFVRVPGVGAGVLTPEGNLASVIDRAVFGRHLLTPLYDPEGLLSTIPASGTALFGVLAATVLRDPPNRHRAASLLAFGVIGMLGGLAWGRVFPINKNLWTSSFALFSAGAAASCLGSWYWLVDVQGWRWLGAPFVGFGRNPLVAYFCSVALDSFLMRTYAAGHDASLKSVVYNRLFASWLRPCCGAETASLAYALAYVGLWAIVLGELSRRRIFIAV